MNVLVHNVVGNVARHMAARRFARHINPKSGCRPIANNKPDRTRQQTTNECLDQHLDTNAIHDVTSIKIRDDETQM